jgi:hypothetical protein
LAFFNDSLVQHGGNKNRWTQEKAQLLASFEAKAIHDGNHLGLNELLATQMRGRTVESIRGQRKKPDHREAVASELRRLVEEVNPHLEEPQPGEDLRVPIIETIRKSITTPHPRWSGERYAQLLEVARRIVEEGVMTGELLRGIAGIFPDIINADPETPPQRREHLRRPARGARAQRRIDYARIQELWKTDRKAAVEFLLGKRHQDRGQEMDSLEEFWAPFVEADSVPWTGPKPRHNQRGNLDGVYDPIDEDDIRDSELRSDLAAGRDGISVEQWKAIPRGARALVYNCVLAVGQVPRQLLCSRTTFVPKVGEPGGP